MIKLAYFRLSGTKGSYCTKGKCQSADGNNKTKIRAGFKNNRTIHSNRKMWRKISDRNGNIIKWKSNTYVLIILISAYFNFVNSREPKET